MHSMHITSLSTEKRASVTNTRQFFLATSYRQEKFEWNPQRLMQLRSGLHLRTSQRQEGSWDLLTSTACLSVILEGFASLCMTSHGRIKSSSGERNISKRLSGSKS